MVYFLRLTLFISGRYLWMVDQPNAGFTSMLFVLEWPVLHTLLGPWSQGGSSSRVARHRQLYPINDPLMSDVGQGLCWKGTVTIEYSQWEYNSRRIKWLILICLQRTIKVYYYFSFLLHRHLEFRINPALHLHAPALPPLLKKSIKLSVVMQVYYFKQLSAVPLRFVNST